MPNVYFLYGNDEFAMARRLKEFEADFTDPTSADMNTARLEARTMGSDELNNAVNAMPFLAPIRLVMLADPSGKYTKPNERKKFLEFIEKVPETARLVIHETMEPRDVNKHWLVKWADKDNQAGQNAGFHAPASVGNGRLDRQ